MRDAIHALKYDGLHGAARPLGTMLAAAIGKLADTAPAEMIVIPVPLHRAKHAERGFNQALTLAAHALTALHRTHPKWRLELAPDAVMRSRPTASQASLTPRRRRINMRGAFKVVDSAAIRSKHVLVIDDIFTTGTTMRSIAQELRRAGAASVSVATLARARLYFTQRGKAAVSFSDRRFQTAENIGRPGGLTTGTTFAESMYSSSKQQSF